MVEKKDNIMEFNEQIETINKKIKTHRTAARSRYFKIARKHDEILDKLYSELVGVIETFVEYAKTMGWETSKSNNEVYQNYMGGCEKLTEYTVTKGTRRMTLYADKAGFVCIGVTHTDVYMDDEYFLTSLENKYAVKYLEVY